MSFYRVGQNKRKKAQVRKRPVWDDTVQDLTVHRATPEDIMLRKEVHKSKNHLSVKLEKMRKDKQKLMSAETQQLAILKEVLYDQNQLQEVLAKSDTMMAVVKDLFGDDPKRFMGFPNVTTAPHHAGDNSSLVASIPDIYTRTEKLSDSLMDQSALNDDFDTSYSDDEVDCPEPISYESRLNLRHFQDYLQEEKNKIEQMAPQLLRSEINKTNINRNNIPKINTGIDTQNERKTLNPAQNETQTLNSAQNEIKTLNPAQMLPLIQTLINQGPNEQFGNLSHARALSQLLASLTVNPSADFQTPTKRTPPLPSERTPPSAMNDTKKIKRSKKAVKTSLESSNTTANMNDMRKVLQELENEISEYEQQTGRYSQRDIHKTETFTGYTMSLVTAVSRLTRYLKETDLRVQTEIMLREQLTQDVSQLRTIIDALATDLILTQEEYGKLYLEHKRYKESTEAELKSINSQLTELKYLVTGKKSKSDSRSLTEDQQQQQNLVHQQQDTARNSNQSDKSQASTQPHNQLDASLQSECGSDSYQSLPAHLVSSEASAAVMLSPPVRKTRVHDNVGADTIGQLPQQQTSLLDLTQLTNEVTAHTADPPRLTQAPPIMNTVSVPRPIPLVQSNFSMSLTSRLPPNQVSSSTVTDGQGKKGISNSTKAHTFEEFTQFGNDELRQLEEVVFDEALNDPEMQSLMQAQIAELNKQQEEARLRLLDLLEKQKMYQKQLHELGSDNSLHFFSKETVNRQRVIQKPAIQSVSPAISPIPQRSAQQSVTSDNLAGHGRGITVSLPTVNLDDSP